MDYGILIEEGIKKKQLTLRQLAEAINQDFNLSVSPTYLSKLKNKKKPPAGDELNDAIASILGIESLHLRTAAYREKIPSDVLTELMKSKVQESVE